MSKISLSLLLFSYVMLQACALQVNVVQTARNTGDRLTKKNPVPFGPLNSNPSPKILVNPSTKFQSIVGFGAAFTDSVAQVFSGLSPAFQQDVLDSYFGEDGLQYNLCRLTIGSCDFSVGSYSYNDYDSDYGMQNFSISHDTEKIIPMIHRAQQTRGNTGDELLFFASPWSPPAWMKQNGYMRNSDMPGLIQKKEIFQAYALYLSRYVTEYAKQGINLWGMTVQNEPHVAGQFLITYECCGFRAEHERDFLSKYLGPQMRKDHPDLKLLIHDDQKPQIVDFVSTILNDTSAAQYVWGAAFHWYGEFLKNYQYLAQLHELYPDLPLLATEATLEAHWKQFDEWAQGQYYAIDIIGDLNNWAVGWVDWNMLLNFEGGPEHSWGPCDAPISAAFEYSQLIYRPSFYHFGHFTKFIPRNSVRIESTGTNTGNLQFTSVLTPANEVVVVVLNVGSDDLRFDLVYNGLSANITIPADGIQTLSFPM